jgi:hypothetical protein
MEANPRKCGDCKFSSLERNESQPMNLERVLFCRHSPVQLVTIPAPGGLTVAGMWPVVVPDAWCFQFEAKPGPALRLA